MALELYLHPLSSYCWKVMIGLYEQGVAFEPVTVNLGDAAARERYLQVSPFGKIPALRDTARDVEVIETSIIIEYVQQKYPSDIRLIPDEPDAALEVRLMDRIFDLHVQDAYQPIVGDRLRPQDLRDPLAVDMAHAKVKAGYGYLERKLSGRAWAAGDQFSMADCAAAPSLFYAGVLVPADDFPTVSAYRERLLKRPSVARAIEEAKPFFHMFPGTEAERARMPA